MFCDWISKITGQNQCNHALAFNGTAVKWNAMDAKIFRFK